MPGPNAPVLQCNCGNTNVYRCEVCDKLVCDECNPRVREFDWELGSCLDENCRLTQVVALKEQRSRVTEFGRITRLPNR